MSKVNDGKPSNNDDFSMALGEVKPQDEPPDMTTYEKSAVSNHMVKQSVPIIGNRETTTLALVKLQLGRDPCRVECPSCHKDIFTNVRHRADAVTWIVFVIVLILFWPLCWLPFVLPSCQSVEHRCPSCHRIISTTKACQ